MGFLTRLFKKEPSATAAQLAESRKNTKQISSVKEWCPLPAYVATTQEETQVIGAIVAAIAAEGHPESNFAVKSVLKRNPEMQLIAVIASCIAANDAPYKQFLVKNVAAKVSSKHQTEIPLAS